MLKFKLFQLHTHLGTSKSQGAYTYHRETNQRSDYRNSNLNFCQLRYNLPFYTSIPGGNRRRPIAVGFCCGPCNACPQVIIWVRSWQGLDQITLCCDWNVDRLQTHALRKGDIFTSLQPYTMVFLLSAHRRL